MLKNLKRTILLIALIAVFCVLFAMIASAETYQLQYKDYKFNNKTKVATDENGQITLLDTQFTANDGKHVFYGWVDDSNGNFYAPGATITLTGNAVLREAFAFEVATGDDFNNVIKASAMKDNNIYKLTADIEYTRYGLIEWSTQAIDLNGHTLTLTLTDNNDALSMKRGKVLIFNSSENEGKIVATLKDTNRGVVGFEGHGYGDGDHGIALVVGKRVTIETNGSLVWQKNNMLNSNQKNCPKVDIYGTVSAKYIVYQGNNQTDAAATTIYEGASVTLSGDTWFKSTNTKETCQATLTMYGGSLKTENEEFVWFDNINKYAFNITGGHVSVVPVPGILKDGYKAVPTDLPNDYEIKLVGCTLPGSNGEHTFKRSEAYEGQESSCTESGMYYYRCNCGEFYIANAPAAGHDYSLVTITKVARYGSAGSKTLTCTRCADTVSYSYQVDPAEVSVKVIVSTDSGNKEITVKAKDLFTYTITEVPGSYTAPVTAIKNIVDPDDENITYNISKIVELHVPSGFTSIVIKNASLLEKVVFDDGVDMNLAQSSFDNCPELVSIEFGKGTVVFNQYVVNNKNCKKFETLDVSKANATFNANAFRDTTIANLKLGSGVEYKFGTESFRNTQLTEVVFPDNDAQMVTFIGGKAFYGIKTLTYVYVGKGITTLNNNPWDCCFNLDLVVLMDVTSMTEYVFCCGSGDYAEAKADDTDPLVVYHHAASLNIHNNTFANRNTYGVKLYTKANVKKMNNCNVYWIYNGIPHAYVEGNVEATCTAMGSTGYTTDCPCGVVENASYSVYTKASGDSTPAESGSIASTTTPALGHDFTVFVSKTTPDCTHPEMTTYKCSRCDATEEKKTASALGHTLPGEWETQTEVSCVADGLKVKYCTVCGLLGDTEIIPATGHTPAAEWTVTVEATCTVGETKVKLCTVCGAVSQSQTGEPLGHLPGTEWILEYDAKCEVAGSEKQVCTRCNAPIQTREITPLGHEYDIAKGAVASAMTYPNGFDKVGTATVKCARCDVVSNAESKPIFKFLGVSVKDSKDEVYFGFQVNIPLLEKYEELNEEIKFGMIIVNADSLLSDALLKDDHSLNSEKGFMIELTSKEYAVVGATLKNIVSDAVKALNVVVTLYTDDKSSYKFISAPNAYSSQRGIGDYLLDVVKLSDMLA